MAILLVQYSTDSESVLLDSLNNVLEHTVPKIINHSNTKNMIHNKINITKCHYLALNEGIHH